MSGQFLYESIFLAQSLFWQSLYTYKLLAIFFIYYDRLSVSAGLRCKIKFILKVNICGSRTVRCAGHCQNRLYTLNSNPCDTFTQMFLHTIPYNNLTSIVQKNSINNIACFREVWKKKCIYESRLQMVGNGNVEQCLLLFVCILCQDIFFFPYDYYNLQKRYWYYFYMISFTDALHCFLFYYFYFQYLTLEEIQENTVQCKVKYLYQSIKLITVGILDIRKSVRMRDWVRGGSRAGQRRAEFESSL